MTQEYKVGWKKVGNLAVDTASLVIADPCILDKMSELQHKFIDNLSEGQSAKAFKKAERILSEKTSAYGAIYISPTSEGDGLFPVFVRYGKTAFGDIRPVEIRIVLTCQSCDGKVKTLEEALEQRGISE